METYEEKQVFKLWWTFIPIAIFSLLPILLFAEEKESMPALIIAGIVLLVVGWLLLSMKQVIRINPNGVYYKQSPFHRSLKSMLLVILVVGVFVLPVRKRGILWKGNMGWSYKQPLKN